VKLIQEKIGSTLTHIGIDNNFMNGTPITQQLRESIDKWDYMKLKSFCKGNSHQIKRVSLQNTLRKSLPAIHLIRD
jgi:hypothetical protein